MNDPIVYRRNESLTYRDAGVNIDAGNALVDAIKPAVKSTQRSGADASIGGFGGVFDLAACNYKDPLLIAATDGVGTKLTLAKQLQNHRTIGIDLVAMCVNDLLVQGAEPLFFLDYFATGALDVTQAAEVVEGVAEGCLQAGCALIGGETAEMPGIYQSGDYDIAGFCVGAVERDQLLPRNNAINESCALIGLASSGVHSNGYSLVRKLLGDNATALEKSIAGDNRLLSDILLAPTKIYIKALLPHVQAGRIIAMAHITGGGITENLPRILPEVYSAEIDCASWSVSPVFQWLQRAGNIQTSEMLRTFNNGIGMVLVVQEEEAEALCQQLKEEDDTLSPKVIGRIVPREGHDSVHYLNSEALYG